MNFEELIKEGVVCIDFWAPWCGPCRMFGPKFDEVKELITDVKFEKIDIDNHPEIAQKLEVRSIPTIVIFKDGQLIAKRTGAFGTAGEFAEWINSHK